MNTTKSVFNKLFSEEATKLATHKIELGIIDDLNKALEESEETIKVLSESKKRVSMFEKDIEKLSKERDKLQTEVSKARDKMFKLQDEYSNAKSKTKDIEDKQTASRNRSDRFQAEIDKENKKGAATTKKAQKQIAIFEKNISKANKMAQDLGVKLPIAKFEKAQDKLKSLI